jgi:hypothetical protein
MLNWLIRKVFGKIAAMSVRRRLRAFEAATLEPQAVQEALLRSFLEHHQATDFGRQHHFRSIATSADYRRQVPIAPYEYFEPYIQRVMRGETSALLANSRIHMFALTSGTTASRKFIPVTEQYLADYKRGWNIWGLKAYRDHAPIRFRPIVQLVGDWQEFHTEAGIPCGAVSGLTAQMQFRIIRWLYCVPAALGKVKDPASKYYLALRLALPRKVGMLISANPSTMVALAKAGDQEKESLLRDLRDGTLSERFDIPGPVRAAVARRIRKQDPERVQFLEDIIRRTGTLYPKDYWPKDLLIGNWTGGSVGAYLRHYPKYFGDTPVRDIGLIASEGRMTIPWADGAPSGVLDISSNYYEFIPEDEVNSPQPTVLRAHELQEGRNYYILLTTSYGLYRYHIYDVVRCTGFHNKTPLVEFLSKGSLFSNLTGEKISEYHVSGAMTVVLRQFDLNVTAYSLAPCWNDELPYYGLFIERGDLNGREQSVRLIQALEQQLCAVNSEYASKRESRRLGHLRLEIIPTGAWQAWDRQRLARTGGTLEQYKHPGLISDPQFRATMPVEEELPAG